MSRTGRSATHRTLIWTSLGVVLTGMSAGINCPGGAVGGGTNPADRNTNHPPTILITGVDTPSGNNVAVVGEQVTIHFTGSDVEDAAVARVFASTSNDPAPDEEILILGGYVIGPGTGSGSAIWDTTHVTASSYNIFAEIDDRTGEDGHVVRVTWVSQVQVVPQGSQPQTQPPNITLCSPLSNLGLSAGDEVTIQYVYSDLDSPVTVTLLLDKDQDPTNDDINNPGDPLDPNSKIIILPSEARHSTDPTFGGDPPPPDNPANPPVNADSVQIRTNPRTLDATNPGDHPNQPPLGCNVDGVLKTYLFTIDFSKIPVRSQPYFMRATISDGTHTVHRYATGSLAISLSATGVVDCGTVGFSVAGSRFHGFNALENLGSDLITVPDIDNDGMDEFVIAGRYASPRNRIQAGAAYLVLGRRKTPFPPDTNGNGLPDVVTPGGVVDFPVPPTFVADPPPAGQLYLPYQPQNVGRFGGVVSINSVGSFFRGTTYGMPYPHGGATGPTDITTGDPDYSGHRGDTAGLFSITRLDMSNDGVADIVFGMPYVSGAWDYLDNDPGDGACPIKEYIPQDSFPHHGLCESPEARGSNDDIFSPFELPDPVDQGMVIVVSGANDLKNQFRLFVDAAMAGQNDPNGAEDDEFILQNTGTVPAGMRFRGGWLGNDVPGLGPVVSTNEYGRTVAAIPSVDNDVGDDLLISAPGTSSIVGGATDNTGAVQLWYSITGSNALAIGGFFNERYYNGTTLSLPGYFLTQPPCIPQAGGACVRGFVATPQFNTIFGAQPGDFLGFAKGAGQFNQDGIADIMLGAPGASRNGHTQNGIFYVIFSPAGGLGNIFLPPPGNAFFAYPPRVEIYGTHDDDQFGKVQSQVGDMDGDGVVDIAFASEFFDDDILNAGADAGYVGVIFGNRPLTGENGFTVDQVGTLDPNGNSRLSGVKFLGASAGAKAGHSIASAGDFNKDGYGDLLITAPGQAWQAGKVVFAGNVTDGLTVGISGRVFEFDLTGSVLPGHTAVVISSSAPAAAEAALFQSLTAASADQSFNIASVAEKIDLQSTLPSVPTITFVARRETGFSVTPSAGNVQTTSVTRTGVTYLIFGGTHLTNKTFKLSDVNTAQLPGMVFVSPYEVGGGDSNASLEIVGGGGDVDGDGFDDILIGAPHADFIDPASPNQRRVDAGDVFLIYGNNFGSNH